MGRSPASPPAPPPRHRNRKVGTSRSRAGTLPVSPTCANATTATVAMATVASAESSSCGRLPAPAREAHHAAALLVPQCQHAAAQGRAEAEPGQGPERSEEHTSELQSLMRISYDVFCLKKKTN